MSAITWSSNVAVDGVQWMCNGAPSCVTAVGAIDRSREFGVDPLHGVEVGAVRQRAEPVEQGPHTSVDACDLGVGRARGTGESVVVEQIARPGGIDRFVRAQRVHEIERSLQRQPDLRGRGGCHVHGSIVPIRNGVRC